MISDHAAEKISADHLRRNAYLYVRQSTLRQVMENTTSTERQYGLRQRAVGLGMGDRSGRRHRRGPRSLRRQLPKGASGFQRLVADVGMGKAGIVIGLEVSQTGPQQRRLAPAARDLRAHRDAHPRRGRPL